MAFVNTDLYLTSGTSQWANKWTANVDKFNTSSFYNWEQDNEPLYDLDERTHQNWEKQGYPITDGFSGIPGVCVVVSAAAFRANFGLLAGITGDSSGAVFKSVSAVLRVLPICCILNRKRCCWSH